MKDGGPAFPQVWHPDMGFDPNMTPMGMSLRDYFAGQVLAGPVTLTEEDMDNIAYREIDEADYISEWAYLVADAMLAERKNP